MYRRLTKFTDGPRGCKGLWRFQPYFEFQKDRKKNVKKHERHIQKKRFNSHAYHMNKQENSPNPPKSTNLHPPPSFEKFVDPRPKVFINWNNKTPNKSTHWCLWYLPPFTNVKPCCLLISMTKTNPRIKLFSLYITRLYAVNWLFWKKKDHWITRQFMKEGAGVIWKSSPQAPELQVRWPRGAFNRCLKRSNITVSSYKYNNIL